MAMRQAARECFEQRFEIKKAAETLQTVLAGLKESINRTLHMNTMCSFSELVSAVLPNIQSDELTATRSCLIRRWN